VLAIPLWLRDVKVVIHLEVTCSFVAFFESRYCQNSADTMNENSNNPLLIVKTFNLGYINTCTRETWSASNAGSDLFCLWIVFAIRVCIRLLHYL
jgi:hypothetical protein